MHPPPFLSTRGGVVKLPTKFSKKERLDRTSSFRGVVGKEVNFFSEGSRGGGCNFQIKGVQFSHKQN